MAERISRYFTNKNWVENTQASYMPNSKRQFTEITLGHGSLPVVIEEIDLGNDASFNALRFSGIFTSDYLDFKGRESVVEIDVLKMISDAKELGSDLVWLSNIPNSSRLFSVLNNLVDENDSMEFIPCVSTFGFVCEETHDDYLKSLSKNTRRNIKRKNKKLDNVGATYLIKPVDQTSIRQFFEMQQLRANEKNMSPIRENDRLRNFIESMVNDSSIYFSTISVSNKPISQLMLLIEDHSIAIYMQAFDPEWSSYSPSFCNISRLTRYAHEQGYSYVDFLRGDEKYKMHFCNTRVDMSKFIAVLNPEIAINQAISYIESCEE